MSNQVVKKSTIEIEVGLNSSNVPESIKWRATDNPNGDGFTECKAMTLAVFDKDHLDTLKIDLWTKEMQIVEMDRFVFQTMRSLADTYYRSTNNEKLANEMQSFIDHFGRQTGIITDDQSDSEAGGMNLSELY
ncbi:MAG: gliding motility protein GldC [Saprospiraceae bacterium]|nr:MAG: gliding motility protein GldC [Bacteroidetes bacterium OLB9]MCO6462661.1 gliding motility protein GldC [Saprospiraceae bacterium]MCZ2337711.1 gliding motility protein GldC [Chitinophagales bacterium]